MTAKRPHIPVMVRLHAALLQLGFEPSEVQLDHDPALGLRKVDPVTGAYVPDANDPRYLIWRPRKEHAAKTTGRRGESRKGDQSSGDVPRIAKVKRLQSEQEEFRRRLLEKAPGEPRKSKSRIPSRPFRKKEPASG